MTKKLLMKGSKAHPYGPDFLHETFLPSPMSAFAKQANCPGAQRSGIAEDVLSTAEAMSARRSLLMRADQGHVWLKRSEAHDMHR